MRMLSGVEAPDAGERVEGHQVVMQYFAQDEATRLDPAPTVYETLAGGLAACRWCRASATSSAASSSPATTSTSRCACCRAASARGWRSRACCCGRRTRCCSTSRPTISISIRRTCCSTRSMDFGGTLIFVSHDRYFVERAGDEDHRDRRRRRRSSIRAPTRSSCGSKEHPSAEHRRGRPQRSPASAAATEARAGSPTRSPQRGRTRPGQTAARRAARVSRRPRIGPPQPDGRATVARRAEARRRRSAPEARVEQARAQADRRARSADRRPRAGDPRDREHDGGARLLRQTTTAAQPVIDRHQALMWEVGDLMHQWEELAVGLQICAKL